MACVIGLVNRFRGGEGTGGGSSGRYESRGDAALRFIETFPSRGSYAASSFSFFSLSLFSWSHTD